LAGFFPVKRDAREIWNEDQKGGEGPEGFYNTPEALEIYVIRR